VRRVKNNVLNAIVRICLSLILFICGSSAFADEDRVAPLEPGSTPANFAADYLWTADQMPLKFRLGFVTTEEMQMNLPTALRYEKILMDAFAEWNKASEGRISMMYVGDQTGWDVGIQIAEKPDDPKSQSRCSQSNLNARKKDTAGQRAFLKIVIPRRADGTLPSDAEVRSICLHELGHVLGLVHSTDKSDVMYPGKDGADHVGAADSAQLLSFYFGLPKVDEKELASRIQKVNQKAQVWSGEELARCQTSLKDKPNDASTVGAIARCYMDLGRFDDAAEEYVQELKMDPDQNNQFNTKLTIASLPRMMQLYELAQIAPVVPSNGKLVQYVKMVTDNPASLPPSNPVPETAAKSAPDQTGNAPPQPQAPAQDKPKPQVSRIPEGEAHFTLDQLKQYYNVYNMPDVHYLRTLFNAYLNGTGATKEETALLKKWDKSYYRSKFMVTSRNIHPFGGTTIQFMFQDRPDKVFDAWVYPAGSTLRPELRALDQSDFTAEDVRRIQVRYKQCLEDKVHAM
jgi:tetratricopeptide (TPR) repeat protein